MSRRTGRDVARWLGVAAAGPLSLACGLSVDQVLPPPPQPGLAEVLAVDTGSVSFRLLERGRAHLFSTPSPPRTIEAALFAASLVDLDRRPGPLDLAKSEEAYLPERVLAWTGTAWRPTRAPRLLANLGIPVDSPERCVERGGCWTRLPAQGREPCRAPCPLQVVPAPPLPPDLGRDFHPDTLAALGDDARLRACRASMSRWDPELGCVAIDPDCEIPAPAPGRTFVAERSTGGSGTTATGAVSLAEARAAGALALVLLPGHHRADPIEVGGELELTGVCPREVLVSGEVLLQGGSLRMTGIHFLGKVRREGGGTLVVEDSVVEGPNDGGVVLGAQGVTFELRRSYVGTQDRPALGAPRSPALFLGFGRAPVRIESSELWGRVGSECVVGTGCELAPTIEIVGSVIVGGTSEAVLAAVNAPPTRVERSLLVGGETGARVAGGRVELRQVDVRGARKGLRAEGGVLVARQVRISSEVEIARAEAGSTVEISDLVGTLAAEPDRIEAAIFTGDSSLELTRAQLAGRPSRFVLVAPQSTVALTDLRVDVDRPRTPPSSRRRVLDLNPGTSVTLTRAAFTGSLDLTIEAYETTLAVADLSMSATDAVCKVACPDDPTCCEPIGVWAGAGAVVELTRARLEGLARAFELRAYRRLRLAGVQLIEARCATNGVVQDAAAIAMMSTGGAGLCAEPRATE